ncbi:sigma factor-like helix-turn-helix DNA-binding protein [Viridibacillus sp. NPDC096237]|uniref:sigma factor-like helix-turn-helix DNA-binding protein n=1 Tax=Viridibacillus sp. NPDC096237 TaxID=3390721 RepID=UPI003D06F6B0
MISVEELIFEYRDSKQGLEEMLLRLDPCDPKSELDKTLINSMLRDIKETIEWMEMGRDPRGGFRAIDKRYVYDGNDVIATIESLDTDEVLPMLDIDDEDTLQVHRELSGDEKRAIRDVISILSVREKQCFMLHAVCRWSHGRIADKLNLKRDTAKDYVKRAKKKIQDKVMLMEVG